MNNINSLSQLNQFLKLSSITPQVGIFGGVSYRVGAASFKLNDLISRASQLGQAALGDLEERKQIFDIIAGIKTLETQGNNRLQQENFLVRIFTVLRRAFANLTFNRNQVLATLEKLALIEVKEKLTVHHIIQKPIEVRETRTVYRTVDAPPRNTQLPRSTLDFLNKKKSARIAPKTDKKIKAKYPGADLYATAKANAMEDDAVYIPLLEKAAEAGHPKAMFKNAEIFSDNNDFDNAIAWFQKVVNSNADRVLKAQAYYRLGNIYQFKATIHEEQKYLEQAQTFFDKAAQLDKNVVPVENVVQKKQTLPS